MKLNDIVTWTGRNGEKRFGLIVASNGNKYRLCDGVSGPDVRGATGFAVNDYP